MFIVYVAKLLFVSFYLSFILNLYCIFMFYVAFFILCKKRKKKMNLIWHFTIFPIFLQVKILSVKFK